MILSVGVISRTICDLLIDMCKYCYCARCDKYLVDKSGPYIEESGVWIGGYKYCSIECHDRSDSDNEIEEPVDDNLLPLNI